MGPIGFPPRTPRALWAPMGPFKGLLKASVNIPELGNLMPRYGTHYPKGRVHREPASESLVLLWFFMILGFP